MTRAKPTAQYKYHIRMKYNLSLYEYQTMLEYQDFRCAICRVEESQTRRALSVDHCHDTDKVRGLLCSDCNIGIGHFKNNPDTLIAAAAYLEHC